MGFPSYMGDPSMYRVHKYMALDPNELGYFISQVGAAAASFGVASADVSIVATALMTYFGYRCTPPETIVDGPQLDSMCLDASCPLDPSPECWLYDNDRKDGESPRPKVASQCAAAASASATSSSWYSKSTGY